MEHMKKLLSASETARSELAQRLAVAQYELQSYKATGLTPKEIEELKAIVGGLRK